MAPLENSFASFDHPLPGRMAKPRDSGLTMVIDKGLGARALEDLLEVASSHIDFLKLGFGTSLCYPRKNLERKISLARSFGVDVYPGGTLLEAALLQRHELAFLDWAAEMGFSYIEVSDGTIDLPAKQRSRLIQKARSRGLGVLTEVGKKEAGQALDIYEVEKLVSQDLEAGATKVIVEARESGENIGIYDEHGKVRRALFDEVLALVPYPHCIMWEAPQSAQQKFLIITLGPNVNLGNVNPADIIALEATRLGLRGDTLRLCIPSSFEAELE